MERYNGKELAEVVANSLNSLTFDSDAFCEQMKREHRTLQQNFMRLVRRYIYETANTQYYDERNEASVELCKRIVASLKDSDIILPYI